MRKFLSLLLMSVLAVGVGWAQTAFYTLEPATGTNNGYANNCDVDINGITWNVTGNAQMVPWRIGGKSLNGVDRTVYSKTAMNSTISKVSLEVGAASNITVNSLKLTVASDEDFSNVLDEVSATFAASSTIDFTPSSGSQWATDSYYKFTFNVTVSGSSNKFVEFKGATFYTDGGDDPEPSEFPAPTFSFNENTLVEDGDAVIVMPENAVSLNYDYGTSVFIASNKTVDQTASDDVTLDLSQFSLRDYVYVNAQAVYADGVSEIVGTAFYVGDPNYAFPLSFAADPVEGGTITGPSTAIGGAEVEFTVTPAEGYTLKSVTAEYTELGNAYGGKDIVFDGNSFTMPAYSKIDVKNEPTVYITAKFEEEAPSSGTFDVTFVAGTDKGSQTGQGTYSDVIEKTGVTLTGHDTPLGNNDNYRVYQNKSIELSVATGNITKIVMTSTANKGSKYGPDLVTASVGDYTTESGSAVGTWVGSTQSVTFTASAQARFTTIAVTVEIPEEGALSQPEISGTTPFVGSTEVTITNPNESGVIYYTVDGGDPTAEDALYDAPFTINETTTVKAVVVDGDKTSSVAQKTFEALQTVESIAEFTESGGDVVGFANPVTVLGQNGNYLYVQDESAAGMIVYGSVGQTYSFGDIIPAGFNGKYTLFRGMHEMTTPAGFEAASGNEVPTAIEVTVNGISTANSGRYAVIKGATISGNNIVVDENSVALYDRFGWTAPEDLTKTYDIYGVTSMYASSNDGDPYAQFLPLSYVDATPVAYTITLAAGENGAIDCTDTEAQEGQEVMFQVQPDAGYRLASAPVVTPETLDLVVEVNDEGDGYYSFYMPADNVTISATFEAIPVYSINIDEEVVNGTIECADTEAQEGDEVLFQVTPNEHWALSGLPTVSPATLELVVEVTDEGDGYFSFIMPADHVTLSATFVQADFQITLANAENVTIEGISDGEYVAPNEEVLFSVAANEGYVLNGLTIVSNDEDVEFEEAEGIYAFVMPEGNVTITFDVAEEAEPVAPLWIIGNVAGTNWQTDSGIEMPFNSESNQYEATITVSGTDGIGYFAIGTVLADNWPDFNAGRLTGAESGNFVVTADNHESIALLKGYDSSFQIADGEYTLIINAEQTTLQIVGDFPVVEEAYYLIGSFNSWNESAEAMTQFVLDESDGYYHATQTMAAYGEFKMKDGNGTWYGAESTGNFIVTQDQVEGGTQIQMLPGGGNNLQIPVAGQWSFTYMPEEQKLVISGEWPAEMTFAEAIAGAEDGQLVQISNAIAVSEYMVADEESSMHFVSDNEGAYAMLFGGTDVEVPETGIAENFLARYLNTNGIPRFELLYGDPASMEYTVEKLSLIQQNADVYRPASIQVHEISGFYQVRDGQPMLSQYRGTNGEVGATRNLDFSALDMDLDNLTIADPYTFVVVSVPKNSIIDDSEPTGARRTLDAPEFLVDYDLMVVSDNVVVITGIDNIFSKVADAKAVRYYNLQGVESSEPFNGMNIVVIEHNDGTRTVQKAIMK